MTGRVTEGHPAKGVPFATVRLKETRHAVTTDAKGAFRLEAPAGSYTLVVSSVGYRTAETAVRLMPDKPEKVHIRLKAADRELGEARVTAGRISRVRQTAYNVVAVDTRALQNTTKNPPTPVDSG